MIAPNRNGGNVADDGTAAIRGEIERTRGDMSRTVNEIELRLSPARIREQLNSVTDGVVVDLEHKVGALKESVIGEYRDAKEQLKDDIGRELSEVKNKVSDELTHARIAVREATVGRVEHMVQDARESVTDAGTSVLGTIKANPIPAALIGIGLGWLIFGGRRSGSSASQPASRPRIASGERARANGSFKGNGDGTSTIAHRVQEGASHLVEGVQHTGHDVGDAVSHFASDAGHRVAEVAGGARDGAMQLAGDARIGGERLVRGAGREVMRAERSVEDTLRENPLALGAVALAVGAAIALALPSTHVEDEWMGAAKDRFISEAEGAAGEVIHKAEVAAGHLTSGDEGDDKNEPITSRGLSDGAQRSSNV
jgi:hypothetical protein